MKNHITRRRQTETVGAKGRAAAAPPARWTKGKYANNEKAIRIAISNVLKEGLNDVFDRPFEVEPRKGEALEKGYLQSRYGALPFIGELRF